MNVARPGLPPPGGLPNTTVLSSPADLARVTAALNTYNGDRTQLSGYRCAGQASGEIGGDLHGFLAAMRISPNI